MKNNKILILQASARSNGNTAKIVSLLASELACDIIDLNPLKIAPYDYEQNYGVDDFLPLMKRIVTYELIIFATPVYWYTMSGILKNFFDRISDCLDFEKDLGRKLRGKHTAVICCGYRKELNPHFFEPIELTGVYLGMKYLGGLNTWVAEEEVSDVVKQSVVSFAQKLKKSML